MIQLKSLKLSNKKCMASLLFSSWCVAFCSNHGNLPLCSVFKWWCYFKHVHFVQQTAEFKSHHWYRTLGVISLYLYIVKEHEMWVQRVHPSSFLIWTIYIWTMTPVITRCWYYSVNPSIWGHLVMYQIHTWLFSHSSKSNILFYWWNSFVVKCHVSFCFILLTSYV